MVRRNTPESVYWRILSDLTLYISSFWTCLGICYPGTKWIKDENPCKTGRFSIRYCCRDSQYGYKWNCRTGDGYLGRPCTYLTPSCWRSTYNRLSLRVFSPADSSLGPYLVESGYKSNFCNLCCIYCFLTSLKRHLYPVDSHNFIILYGHPLDFRNLNTLYSVCSDGFSDTIWTYLSGSYLFRRYIPLVSSFNLRTDSTPPLNLPTPIFFFQPGVPTDRYNSWTYSVSYYFLTSSLKEGNPVNQPGFTTTFTPFRFLNHTRRKGENFSDGFVTYSTYRRITRGSGTYSGTRSGPRPRLLFLRVKQSRNQPRRNQTRGNTIPQ